MPAPTPDSRFPTAAMRCYLRKAAIWLLVIAALVTASLACNLSNRAADLQATISSLNALQTALSATSTALGTLPAAPQPTPVIASPVETIASTQTPPTAADPVEPTTPQALEPSSDERLMQSARILLFEDMSASRQVRLVKEALDRADYFYLDVGSARGWFKDQLLSGEEWDLVIASGEADRGFGGEFFEYLDAQVAAGGSAIVETWDLDSAPDGRARPLLDRCGLEVQADWFEPNLRVFFWTDETHPLFNQPNSLTGGLRNARTFWHGDIGDLLKLSPEATSTGRILASTNPEWTADHGLLIDCLDGRLILQTFRSHEYHHDDAVALWQNYIDYALHSHFAYTGHTAPPAAPTAPLSTEPTAAVNYGATPGPDYTIPHSCGSALTARMLQAPHFQVDLFEHHALGTYLILQLELVNTGSAPIQIWDEDYAVDAILYDKPVSYSLNRPASGYLFIDGSSQLYQDLLDPGETWQTSLAFDVDPAAADWVFVLRPGFEFNETACEVRVPLTR